MTRRCLVLGGTGFLGSHLCSTLLRHGYLVRVLTRHSEKGAWENIVKVHNSQFSNASFRCNTGKNTPFNLLRKSFECIIGDFSDRNIIFDAIKNVDYVFHLISTTIPASSNKNPVFDIESNIVSTLNLLEACQKNNVSKVIYYSSGGTIYGIPNYFPINELHPTNPISSYGIHKLAVEKYMQLFNYLYDIKAIILRISNPYGVGQSLFKGQGLIATCLHKVIKNEEIEIWGDGSVVRDYIYVDDVMSANLRALDLSIRFGIYNIGSGEGRSVNEVIKTIENTIGTKARVKYQELRRVDVPINILNIQHAKHSLGWEPEISFEDGITHFAGLQQSE
jgi:UDP-glucose 4-epimerase